MTMTAIAPTAADYARIFEEERQREYPVIDAFEHRMGYAIDRARLEGAARVLACPLKSNPPNWQHGRVIYAAARRYLSTRSDWTLCVDIGTAKGFSALCLRWALNDAGVDGYVFSVDVIDPESRVRRNTVSEVDGYRTLAEIMEPWADALRGVTCACLTGVESLNAQARVHVVFVDGKHQYEVVRREVALIRAKQQPGDLAIFDDLQIPGVHQAVATLQGYDVEDVSLPNGRRYAVAVRR